MVPVVHFFLAHDDVTYCGELVNEVEETTLDYDNVTCLLCIACLKEEGDEEL